MIITTATRLALPVLLLVVALLPCAVWAQSSESAPPGTDNDLQFWEELAFWEAIKDSDNPAEYEAYLATYPAGRFADLARLRIQTLSADTPDEPVAPEETPPALSAPVIDAATAPGTVFQDCPDCPAMVVIPAGEFSMGSTEDSDEQPVHPVSIPRPLALSVHEITNAHWDACLREGGCRSGINRGTTGFGKHTRQAGKGRDRTNDALVTHGDECAVCLAHCTHRFHAVTRQARADAIGNGVYVFGLHVGRINIILPCFDEWRTACRLYAD